MTYRTDEQFETMVDNMVNGNWSDAMQNAVDGGWWASDIFNYLMEHPDVYQPEDTFDWCYVVEGAMKIRSIHELHTR